MSVHRKGSKWAVRYREGDQNRSKTFDKRRDADRFDAEVTRRRQLGELAALDAGRESLDDFVTQTWAPTYAVTLAPKTRQRDLRRPPARPRRPPNPEPLRPRH